MNKIFHETIKISKTLNKVIFDQKDLSKKIM